jgi:hypothetical protein
MSPDRIPVTIPVQPWFFDHSIGGKCILPAVETMLLLGSEVQKKYPAVDIRIMEDASFAKFMEIPPASTILSVLLESAIDVHGRVQVKLLSRTQFKSMSRIKEHGEMFFSSINNAQPADIDPAPLTAAVTKVKAKQLYRELVPFGLAYQTLIDTLYLTEHEAWGRLKAPNCPVADAVQGIMGSPFPLDGALHAACVLGQQSVDFVPFPVGFFRRRIVRPTQAGEEYLTKVKLLSRTRDELSFDLGIFDIDGQVYETVTGVRMRTIGIKVGLKQ